MKDSEMSTTTLPHSPPLALNHTVTWSTLFILMWSSGYVAGKVGLPYAGPLTLIFIRFAIAASVLLAIALLTKAPWPKDFKAIRNLAIVGFFIQAMQFSGLYFGLSHGVSAGISALIVGLMPVLTAAGAAAFLGETVTRKQMAGLGLGIIGVATVVAHKISLDKGSAMGYAAVATALIGITIGTLFQKKHCVGMDLRTGGVIQLTTATLVVGPMAWFSEHFAVQWSLELIGASVWLSLVNSIGAISVLFIMMRRGQASKVASLFYLVPGVTALMGYVVLHETLNAAQILGFAISASGVYLTTRSK